MFSFVPALNSFIHSFPSSQHSSDMLPRTLLDLKYFEQKGILCCHGGGGGGREKGRKERDKIRFGRNVGVSAIQSKQYLFYSPTTFSESYKFIRMADDLHGWWWNCCCWPAIARINYLCCCFPDVASYLNEMRICFLLLTGTVSFLAIQSGHSFPYSIKGVHHPRDLLHQLVHTQESTTREFGRQQRHECLNESEEMERIAGQNVSLFAHKVALFSIDSGC